jgi:hypothetical protein
MEIIIIMKAPISNMILVGFGILGSYIIKDIFSLIIEILNLIVLNIFATVYKRVIRKNYLINKQKVKGKNL